MQDTWPSCTLVAVPAAVFKQQGRPLRAHRAARQMRQYQLLTLVAFTTDGAVTWTLLTLCGFPAAAPDPHGQPGSDAAGQPAEQAGSGLCASGRQLQWVSQPLLFMALQILLFGLSHKPRVTADSVSTPVNVFWTNDSDHTAPPCVEAGSQHSWSQSAAGASKQPGSSA